MPMLPMPPKNFASPLASIQGNHVGVRVPDFEAAKRWYHEKLDFRVVQEWPFGDLQLAYMAPATDDTFFIEILGGGTPSERAKSEDLNSSLVPADGYHHFCLQVENVDETLAELRRRGVTIVGDPFDLEVISRRLAFIADPWENMIEFAQLLY
jgi:catechol 2,3-dioxygenase-like lactoylglutathione lyase family enzyme